MSLICIDSETESYVECPTATQSRVIINGIDHDTASTIDITIPSEFSRDYTGTGETIQINISGYNVDDEYIQNVIAQTKAGATAEDFETLITTTEVFIPYLFIALLIAFAIMLIKKFFRG